MKTILLFIILSIPVTVLSWRSLSSYKNHGFYRYFAWEGMVWLLANNYRYWFKDPFSINQLISWILLFIGAYVVIAGLMVFDKQGKSSRERKDDALFDFEKTTKLIDTGIYAYIRHPLYSSLIYLTWGMLFKHVTIGLLIVAALSTVFLYITSKRDEKECVAYFGDQYTHYMKRTKMFVPFVF